MATAGDKHYILFFGVATGLHTADFSIDVFSTGPVGGELGPVDAATLESLDINEISFSGYYIATYVPSSAGVYLLGLSNVANSLHITDSIVVDEASSSVNLTQDTGGVGALKPTLPNVKNGGLDLTEYLLFVFESSDWDVGRTDPIFAVASTELDADGNWIATPLVVSPSTYHIVIQNNFGVRRVIKAHLVV